MLPLTLHLSHGRRGARFETRLEVEIVRSFGNPEAEYKALRTAAGLIDQSARDIVRVGGEDRDSFVHGMVTQDVKGLPVGRTTYAAMVTAKGAMVADARIWKLRDELLIEVEPGLGPKVKDFLEKYLISEDAEVSIATPELAALSLWGPQSGKVFGEAFAAETPQPEQVESVIHEDVRLLGAGDPAVPIHGVALLVPRASLEKVYEWIIRGGAVPIGEDAAEMVRVEAGVPRYGRDMDDSTIPLEAELQRAISYNKGCYIGQEVIARGTFRGHMNRKLTGLVLSGGEVPAKTPLRFGDKKVGWVTTAVSIPGRPQVIALGYVHRNHLEPGTVLQIADTPQTATVHPLPFELLAAPLPSHTTPA